MRRERILAVAATMTLGLALSFSIASAQTLGGGDSSATLKSPIGMFNSTCGNGVIDSVNGETCDPPGTPAGGNGNLCGPECTSCGDGISGLHEECDDANGVDGDNCTNDCRWNLCGNGSLENGETCDPPGVVAGGNGQVCRVDCTVCGDRHLNGNETCDDGNGVNDDGCANNCETPGCSTPSDCDDHQICTDDVCINGVCINRPSSDSTCLCAEIDCPSLGPSASITTTVDANGDVTVVFVESTDINDNSYGANRVNWPRDHKFDDLKGSDKAQFVFRNGSGQVVFDFFLDYISAKSGTPSGMGSFGANGGDGKVNSGQLAWLMSYDTSLNRNLNNTGYCSGGSCIVSGVNLLLISPPTIPLNISYNLPAAFSQWDFSIRYSVKVSHLAFGASGFGGVTVPAVHNSPPKCGDNATTFDRCPCSGTIGDFVWHDLNQNGHQDPGEPGIGSVDLRLTDGNDALVAEATTDGSGHYHFNEICPGFYAVTVVPSSVPAGFTPTAPCDIDMTVPDDTNCQPAPVDLVNNGDSNPTIDFGYYRPPPPPCEDDSDCNDNNPCTADACVGGVCVFDDSQGGTCLCASSDCPSLNPAGSITTSIDGAGDVTITFRESTSINDNSYGTNVVNWPKAHSFSALAGSDKAQFVITNGNGDVVLDFYLDYITRTNVSASTPSGYYCLGVTGGDGRVNLGQAAWILSSETSLSRNLNSTGYCANGACVVSGVNLLQNSPPTSPSNTYNVPAAFSQWEFPIRYQVKVSHLAFESAGFGGVTVPSLHNSPPKCGDNVTTFGPCGPIDAPTPAVNKYQPPLQPLN